MQAIIAKYLPATNTKPSRIRAACERGSIVVSYPDEFSGEECYRYAVNQLVNRFAAEDLDEYGSDITSNPWLRPTVCGQIPDGRYVFVFVEDKK